MAIVNNSAKKSYPVKITTPNEEEECSAVSLKITVNGQEIKVLECEIDPMEPGSLLTATIKVPVVFGD